MPCVRAYTLCVFLSGSLYCGYFPRNEMNCASLRDAAFTGHPAEKAASLFAPAPLFSFQSLFFLLYFGFLFVFFFFFFYFPICGLSFVFATLWLYNEPCVSSCIVMATGSGCCVDLPVTKRSVSHRARCSRTSTFHSFFSHLQLVSVK